MTSSGAPRLRKRLGIETCKGHGAGPNGPRNATRPSARQRMAAPTTEQPRVNWAGRDPAIAPTRKDAHSECKALWHETPAITFSAGVPANFWPTTTPSYKVISTGLAQQPMLSSSSVRNWLVQPPVGGQSHVGQYHCTSRHTHSLILPAQIYIAGCI